MQSKSLLRSAAVAAALAVAVVAQAAQGSLGFSVAAETDGMFSRTLKSVKVTAVVAGAPADKAGLQVGDDVQAINDVAIAGANGSKVMDIVHGVQPGEHLRLKVLRANAEKVVDIVAVAK